ncbi:MAG TPA: hypothetical protein VM347_36735, partial [Nonomuraea sp.]|nr:hypothetical protein [Nonomuraea sp.]
MLIAALWARARLRRSGLALGHVDVVIPRLDAEEGLPRVRHIDILSAFGAIPHMTSSTEATSSTPQVAVNDIGSEEDFLAAIDETIKYFNDGDIVEG